MFKPLSIPLPRVRPHPILPLTLLPLNSLHTIPSPPRLLHNRAESGHSRIPPLAVPVPLHAHPRWHETVQITLRYGRRRRVIARRVRALERLADIRGVAISARTGGGVFVWLFFDGCGIGAVGGFPGPASLTRGGSGDDDSVVGFVRVLGAVDGGGKVAG